MRKLRRISMWYDTMLLQASLGLVQWQVLTQLRELKHRPEERGNDAVSTSLCMESSASCHKGSDVLPDRDGLWQAWFMIPFCLILHQKLFVWSISNFGERHPESKPRGKFWSPQDQQRVQQNPIPCGNSCVSDWLFVSFKSPWLLVLIG